MAVLAWICGAAQAGPVPRLTLAEMADGSEYIIEATVLRSWTDWNAADQPIWTHHELSVKEWLKAPGAAERTIVVSEPAGDVGYATTYTPGEYVLVLAWRTPEGFLRAAGAGQGKFTITGFAGSHDQRVRWNPAIFRTLRDAREPDGYLDGMRLDDFKTYVRRLVRFEGERRSGE